MRVATAVLFASLALIACHKKAEAPAEPPAEQAIQPVPQPTNIVITDHGPRVLDDAAQKTDEAEAEPEEPALKITTGATYELTEGADVAVMNPAPVSDGTWRYPTGSACTTVANATVTVIGRGGDDVLLRYHRAPARKLEHPVAPAQDSASENSENVVYECPEGTVYFTDDASALGSYEETSARYEKARQILQSEHQPKTKP